MTRDVWLEELYFDWLRIDAFSDPADRVKYEGVLRTLHDIPFVWVIWSDENRAGDALSFRQSDFLSYQPGIDEVDQMWLGNWATASPSVLEVLLGMARRWHFYFETAPVSFFFAHMFHNLGLERWHGKHLSSAVREHIADICNNWMTRQFQPDGKGSPFPVDQALQVVDMRVVDIWAQMNAYSAEHFQ